MFLFLCHILCYDIWFYALHIVLHKPTIYYIHKIHHFKHYEKLTYSDTTVCHYIENIIEPIGIIIPLFVIRDISYIQFIYAFIFTQVRSHMRHDNRFSWLIGNHHLLHHKHPKYNFGEYWIDVLCGTKYPNEEEYIYGMIYV
jgi:sterol desaturase/sphingolipid hydroxylase (fatty acid hydroxylase superfamily)